MSNLKLFLLNGYQEYNHLMIGGAVSDSVSDYIDRRDFKRTMRKAFKKLNPVYLNFRYYLIQDIAHAREEDKTYQAVLNEVINEIVKSLLGSEFQKSKYQRKKIIYGILQYIGYSSLTDEYNEYFYNNDLLEQYFKSLFTLYTSIHFDKRHFIPLNFTDQLTDQASVDYWNTWTEGGELFIRTGYSTKGHIQNSERFNFYMFDTILGWEKEDYDFDDASVWLFKTEYGTALLNSRPKIFQYFMNHKIIPLTRQFTMFGRKHWIVIDDIKTKILPTVEYIMTALGIYDTYDTKYRVGRTFRKLAKWEWDQEDVIDALMDIYRKRLRGKPYSYIANNSRINDELRKLREIVVSKRDKKDIPIDVSKILIEMIDAAISKTNTASPSHSPL